MKHPDRSIAFFDFDGTIITRDSTLDMIRYAKGLFRFSAGFALMSPWLIAMKFGLASNSKVKERVLRYFFKGTAVDDFNNMCARFAREKLPALVRPGAIERIREHQLAGTVIVVVSASPENYIASWCREHQLDCIATRLEVAHGKITGNIDGKNCHGQEKVERIKRRYELSGFSEIFAYGDSSGDKPMLQLANHAYYKPFRK